MNAPKTSELIPGLIPEHHGVGPLLQRDYWGVIEACRVGPVALMADVVRKFPEFAPPALVAFERKSASVDGLEPGDELSVTITAGGTFGVRVVSKDEQSVTLATLSGHPEAGRITFGAYRSSSGEVIFHIRSRARASTQKFALGYAAFGEAMQTNTWSDFIWSVACTFGTGVLGTLHADTRELVPEAAGSAEDACSPTFLARGG